MDKVQFQLEATLPELKDLYEKGLFTKSEINQITKKRTSFETSLIRRVTRKEDFFKYAEYEINLERLRKVRYKKLKYHLNPPPPSASSFSLPRRALYILKRATAKFPGDLATWLAYVEYASVEGMRKVVGKGLNNALQHHPTSSTLYLLQTYYHLHPGSPFPRESIPSTSKLDLPSASSPSQPPGFAIEGIDPARTTLLLGLRLIPQSRELWREYIKLELGWVEALRRRWKLLGIKDNQEQGETEGGIDIDVDQDALKGGEGAFGEEGEEARKAILSGQLVIHALTSALEAIPSSTKPTNPEQGDGMEFRGNLISLFRNYPSPLRRKCLSVLYEELQLIADGEDSKLASKAKLILLIKGLYDRHYNPEDAQINEGDIVLEGVELVEELGKIGKEIRKSVKGDNSKSNQDWIEVVGLWLIEQIGKFDDNAELREYLSSILSSITKPSLQPPPSLLIAHLATLATSPDLELARKYASIYPADPSIQYYRLTAEIIQSNDFNLTRKTCLEVAQIVTRPNLTDDQREKVRSIWKLAIDHDETEPNSNEQTQARKWKLILRESLRSGSNIPGLHGDLLGYYFVALLKKKTTSNESIDEILQKVKSYQPSPDTYQLVFDSSNSSEIALQPNDLKKVYDQWRITCKSPIEKAQAALRYSKYLLGIKGKGKEAYDVIEAVKREIKEDEDVERFLEQEWKALLDGGGDDEDEDKSGDEDMIED